MKDPRDRASAFDRLLRAAVREAAAGGQDGSCPDPHLMAAYVERTLTEAERAGIEEHAATCERCQAVLGALVDVQDLPGTHAGEPASARWWHRAWPWMVPLTAVASAAIIYVAVRPSPVVQVGGGAPVMTDQGAAPVPPRAGGGADGTPAGHLGQRTDTQAPDGKASRTPLTPELGRLAERRQSAVPPAAETEGQRAAVPVPSASGRFPPENANVVPKAEAQPSGGFAPAPARDTAAGAEERLAVTSERAGRADIFRSQPVAEQAARSVPQAAAPPSAPAPAAEAAAAKAAGAASSARPAVPPVEGLVRSDASVDLAKSLRPLGFSASPDRASIWRLPDVGGIERSTDGGRTWQPQRIAIPTGLLALRAVDATTCWAVGRAGSVLRTTDGDQWFRLPFPAMSDLVAIDATSARGATVTTADGRVFSTNDGGRTWHAQ